MEKRPRLKADVLFAIFFAAIFIISGAVATGNAESYSDQASSAVAAAGEETAKEITARYKDTTTSCPDDKANFYCRGVLLRVTDAAETFHSWNPSNASIKRNGVSFYYLSAGDGISDLQLTGVGLIFSNLAASSGKYPLEARCAYPSNGYTELRADSCDARRGYPKSGPCDEQGITTVEAWVAHYRNSGSGKYQCSFKVDKESFSLSQEVRNYFPVPGDKSEGNEIIFAAWPQDIPKMLPLEAIFYLQIEDIAKAQLIQRDFYEQTGEILPILGVDLKMDDENKFAYFPEDQAIIAQKMP